MNRRSALQGMAASAAVLHPSLRSSAPAAQDEVERLLRLTNVPSVSLAIVDGDRITTESRGVARAGDATKASSDTVYAAASLTKVVFAWALLGLVHEGALSLDRPLTEILPLPNPDDARAKSITARHLLSHSGGWRNWRNNMNTPLTADFDPGSRWSYSGEGFFFMQRVVEKLTGKAVGRVIRDRVFTPLGMTSSALLLPESLDARYAPGHNTRGEQIPPYGATILRQLRSAMAARNVTIDDVTVEDAEQAIRVAEPTLPVLPNFLLPNAAASLVTTTADFGRFLRHMVTARAAGGTPAAIAKLMTTPTVRGNEAVSWGLGAGLEQVDGRQFSWQWGDNSGYKNFFFADVSGGKAMVVFCNGDRGARVYERVIRAKDGRDHPAFLYI